MGFLSHPVFAIRLELTDFIRMCVFSGAFSFDRIHFTLLLHELRRIDPNIIP